MIDHAGGRTMEVTPTSDFDSFGEVGSVTSDGNFPEPALTRCGDADGTTFPIETLRSAWGVVAIGGTEADDGEVEAGTIRLRLSDEAMADCQDALDVGGWGLAMTLTPAEATPGERELGSLFAPELEAVHGGHSTSVQASGTLAIARVTQDCLVGVLSNVVIDDLPAPELSGSFAAELCARTCLPTATNGC